MVNKVNNENYYVVQGWMVKDLQLKGLQLNLYAIIYGFSQAKGQMFTGSLQYLADWNGCTKRGVMKALQGMVDSGILCKVDNVINNVKFCSYYATEFTTPMEQSSPPPMELSSPNNIVLDNISNNIDKKDIEKRIEKPALKKNDYGFSDKLNAVVTDWLQYKKEKGQNYKPTGLKVLLEKIKEKVSQTNEAYVIDSINNSMASNYQGITYRTTYNASQQKPINNKGVTCDYDKPRNNTLFE